MKRKHGRGGGRGTEGGEECSSSFPGIAGNAAAALDKLDDVDTDATVGNFPWKFLECRRRDATLDISNSPHSSSLPAHPQQGQEGPPEVPENQSDRARAGQGVNEARLSMVSVVFEFQFPDETFASCLPASLFHSTASSAISDLFVLTPFRHLPFWGSSFTSCCRANQIVATPNLCA